jgi:ABC-2 type transport system permease protein
MRHSVFWHTLRETRRPLIFWTVGMAGAAWFVLLAHPLFLRFADSGTGAPALPSWLGLLLGETGGLAGAGVWLRSVGFGLVLPLALVIFTIRQGSWLVAGEEERSSLGLLLAAPLQRCRLIFEKFAVLVLLALAPAAGVWLALSLVLWLGWLPLGGAALAGACAILFLVGLAFGAPAMALGSLTGKRWLSFGFTLAFALLMLLISRLPGSLPIQPVLRLFSPFYYYNAALLNHLYWVHALVLAVMAAGGLALAWTLFEHRDLPV